MSIAKIAIVVGVSIVTAGGTAAVATRDKWWPKDTSVTEDDNSISEASGAGTGGAARTGDNAGQATVQSPGGGSSALQAVTAI